MRQKTVATEVRPSKYVCEELLEYQRKKRLEEQQCSDKIYRVREDGTKVFSFYTPTVSPKPESPMSDRNLFRFKSPCVSEVYDLKTAEHGGKVLDIRKKTGRPALTP